MQTKEDLRAQFQARLSRLFADGIPPDAAKRYRFMHTSGTTGLPLPVLYTDRPDWEPKFLGTGPRVLMIFGSKPLRVDFARTYMDEDTAPSDIMCLNAKVAPAVLELVRTDFKPTSFVCPPSVLLRVTKEWPAASREAITSITLTGELATKMVSAEITSRFPNAVVRNYFPSVDAGLMGEQCPRCEWNEFHPAPGVRLDIHEPNEEGLGYLLVTKKNQGGLDLEGYLTGDIAQTGNHDNGEPVIRLHGRQGFDYIKLAGALLVREEFDRVMGELGQYVDDYKAEVRTAVINGSPLHQMTIFVRLTTDESKLPISLADELADRIFVTPNSTLKQACEDHIFAPIEVRVVPEITHTGTKPQRLRLIE